MSESIAAGGAREEPASMAHSTPSRSRQHPPPVSKAAKKSTRLYIKPLAVFQDKGFQQAVRNVIKDKVDSLLSMPNLDHQTLCHAIIALVKAKIDKKGKRKLLSHYDLQNEFLEFQQQLLHYNGLRVQLQKYRDRQHAEGNWNDAASDSDDDEDDDPPTSNANTPSSTHSTPSHSTLSTPPSTVATRSPPSHTAALHRPPASPPKTTSAATSSTMGSNSSMQPPGLMMFSPGTYMAPYHMQMMPLPSVQQQAMQQQQQQQMMQQQAMQQQAIQQQAYQQQAMQQQAMQQQAMQQMMQQQMMWPPHTMSGYNYVMAPYSQQPPTPQDLIRIPPFPSLPTPPNSSNLDSDSSYPFSYHHPPPS